MVIFRAHLRWEEWRNWIGFHHHSKKKKKIHSGPQQLKLDAWIFFPLPVCIHPWNTAQSSAFNQFYLCVVFGFKMYAKDNFATFGRRASKDENTKHPEHKGWEDKKWFRSTKTVGLWWEKWFVWNFNFLYQISFKHYTESTPFHAPIMSVLFALYPKCFSFGEEDVITAISAEASSGLHTSERWGGLCHLALRGNKTKKQLLCEDAPSVLFQSVNGVT